MNTPDNFDELSRRKLAEREFPFEEAHWADVQRALETRRKRRIGWLPLAAVGVLLVGGVIWWVAPSVHQPAEVAATGTVVEPTEGPTSVVKTEEPSAIVRTDDPVDPTVVQGNELAGVTGVNARKVVDAAAMPSSSPLVPAPSSTKTETPIEAVSGMIAEELPRIAVVETPIGNEVVNVLPVADVPNTVIGDPMNVIEETNASDTKTAPVEHGTKTQSSALNAQQAESATVPPIDLTTPVPSDTTVVHAIASVAQDTLLTTMPPQQAASTGTKPFLEFSLLGGAHNTATKYTGGNSAEWGNALSSVTTPTFGAEMMRLGRNTGIGFGVHYTCYKERFNSEDRFRTDVEYRNSYFLDYIDTTVTIVVGIDTTGGDTAYLTQQVTTTVTVLDSSTDTISTSTRTAEGRSHVNSVCYLEIPVLLDAHLTQGPWIVGVRGGPYFGLLTGRRGALPNAAWTEYTDLADQPFSALMLGYTARAYVRYRFNAAWSIGIEPSYRGQLLNAFSSGDIARRSHAAGVLLSLNYSLR